MNWPREEQETKTAKWIATQRQRNQLTRHSCLICVICEICGYSNEANDAERSH